MRAQCCICADLFENSGNLNIAAVPCGHTFHEECLMRWLANSSTCPSCRKQVKKNQIIKRLFFDIPEINEEENEDSDTLHNQIAALKAQICSLGALKQDLKEVQDKLAACAASKEEVREQLKKAEREKSMFERHLIHVGKENESMQKDLVDYDATKKKLRKLENIQLMLEGTEEDLNEMVKCHGESGESAIQQLSSMLVVMKREYSKALDDKKSFRNENRELNLQVILGRTKMTDMKKELKQLSLQLKESIKTVSCLEKEKNINRRKIVHLRNALKRNKTEGSHSFIAAINEESPNVAYTPPPPPSTSSLTKPDHPTDSNNRDIDKCEIDNNNVVESSKSSSKCDRQCFSPDLFDDSIGCDNDVKAENIISSNSSNRDSDNESQKREFYESAPSVLKLLRITTAAEKFQAAKQRKIELEKDSAPSIPYSNFSIMQKKLTGISSSRPLTLLKSGVGLPPSRTYNGLGGSTKIEEPFDTPIRRAAKCSELLKKKVTKKRCPLASKPIPNQPKLKSCMPAASSTPSLPFSRNNQSSISSKSSSIDSTVTEATCTVSPIKNVFSSKSDHRSNNKSKQSLVNNMFAKSTPSVKNVGKSKTSVATSSTAVSNSNGFRLDRLEVGDFIDLT